METLKKLIIAMALAAGLMPVAPVYAMGLDDEDEKHAEDTKEVAAVSEEESAAAVAHGLIEENLAVKRAAAMQKREALTEEERTALDDGLAVVLRNDSLTADDKVNKVHGFLEAGANPNAFDETNGYSALNLAMGCKGIVLIDLLLDYGAEVNEVSSGHINTALSSAVIRYDLSAARVLLERGANPNIADRYGETLLIRAASSGNVELVELLVRYGADPNAQNAKGETALLNAGENCMCKRDTNAIKKILIFAGADASKGASDRLRKKRVVRFMRRDVHLEGVEDLSPLVLERLQGETVIAQARQERKRIINKLDHLLRSHIKPKLPLVLVDEIGDYLFSGAGSEMRSARAAVSAEAVHELQKLRQKDSVCSKVSSVLSALKAKVFSRTRGSVQAAVAMPVAVSASSALVASGDVESKEEETVQAAQEGALCPKCTLFNPAGVNNVCAACEHFITSDEPQFFD